MSGKITNLESGKCATIPGLKGCPGRVLFWQTPWVIKYSALSTLPVTTAVLCRLRVSITMRLGLSSMPTAVLGDFPQPEVSKDPLLKPALKITVNMAELQPVATYSQIF